MLFRSYVAYGWEAQTRAAIVLEDHDSARAYLVKANALLPAISENNQPALVADLEALAARIR